MEHLPVWLSLRDRDTLIVGGGAHAATKARLLARTGARITLVARSLAAETAALAAADTFRHRSRAFEPGDVLGQAAVFAATGVESVDREVSEAARAAGVPVNAVDRPALSTFLMPAIVDRSPVVVGISTGGAVPALAAAVRARIEQALPTGLGRLARFAESFRPAVKAKVPAGPARLRFWHRVLDGPIAEAVLAGDEDGARDDMMRFLNSRDAAAAGEGTVYLVGAGPGSADLLTLRAVRLIQRAEVLVYDRLVGPDILEFARRDAERVFAGKESSRHELSQDAINTILLARARAGLRVVRLKGGDPFIFGRGGEEAEFLRHAGIAVEVVPGVTAAVACAAVAGVPLTHRDHAIAVTLVAGHTQDGTVEPDWASLAATRHTLAVYMGVANAGNIAARLIAHGMDGATPVAVIENGTLPSQRVFSATLAELGLLVARNGIGSPALILIGEVTREAAAGVARAALVRAEAG